MNWTEITVHVPIEFTEVASAIANMTVPYGIYIEDYSDLEQNAWEIAHIDLIDEELIEKDRSNSIIHIYISECDKCTAQGKCAGFFASNKEHHSRNIIRFTTEM